MNIELSYDKQKLVIDVPDKRIAAVLRAQGIYIDKNEDEAIVEALDNPIETTRVENLIDINDKVVIITSDISRPVPSRKILPQLLKRIRRSGISPHNVKIVFALGNHRKHTEEEKIALVGKAVYEEYHCIDSDPSDVVHLGKTKAGTPVDIFSEVARADKRICIGNIEYHYFAGYSGGMKAVMPGVSTREAIQANHRFMIDQNAHAGKMTGNPVREDIDEVHMYCPVHFLLNVVLSEDKRIIKAFAGDIFKAHRKGCDFLDSLYKSPIDTLADIVLVSAGGFPKDINLYQAQKALDNAKHAVKKGGIIILVAACKEGLGEEVFERWVMSATSSKDLVEKIYEKFELGGHKAAAIAMVREQNDIYLVSDLPTNISRKCFMTPFPSVQDALARATMEKGADSTIHIIPFGGSVLPTLRL